VQPEVELFLLRSSAINQQAKFYLMQKLAIFGGAFDPIHWGHLLIAQTALNQVPIEKVIWLPSYNPHHKQTALFEHRLAMLQLAVKDHPAFTISRVAIEDSKKNYAINTLIELASTYPNTHWYWIIGLDAFRNLPRWYRGCELAQMCDWLIAPRLLGGETIAQSELICKQVEQEIKARSHTINWQFLSTPLVGVSSSFIRQVYSQGDSIRYLVPESVRLYITAHQLYSSNLE